MLESSFVRKKLGPLPVWAWMGLGLGGALAISSWRRNKEAAGKSAQVVQQYELPENIDPQYTFVDADTTLNTYDWSPPGGGRPPIDPVATPPPVTVATPPKLNVDLSKLKLDLSRFRMPTQRSAPPPPQGRWETISRWKGGQSSGTPSTLWGLAEKVYGSGKGSLWSRIWNAPQNADLRARRGVPEKIQPGDRFWVPA